MPDLHHTRTEIEYMRRQIGRQQKEILSLRRAGIPTVSAEALLARMQTRADGLCELRDRLKGEERLKQPTYATGKPVNGNPAHRRT